MEWHWQIPIARYGEAWRQGRKLLDRGLRPGAAATYRPMQQARVRVLLTRLLANPDQWRAHIELCEIVSDFTMIYVFIIFIFRFQGELILDMTYGYEVKGPQDRKLVVSKQLNEFATVKVPASAWIINAFPFRTQPHFFWPA
jgi:hypothetical protein